MHVPNVQIGLMSVTEKLMCVTQQNRKSIGFSIDNYVARLPWRE